MNKYLKKTNVSSFWTEYCYLSNEITSDMSNTITEKTETGSIMDPTLDNFYPVPENQAICFYRMSIIEKFEGDEETGFVKPLPKVVSSVKGFLRKVYENNPNLESPIISPSRDGEVIVSWRKRKGYFLCYFDEESEEFEWIFKQSKMINGTADPEKADIQKDVSSVVTCFYHPEKFFLKDLESKNKTTLLSKNDIGNEDKSLTSSDETVQIVYDIVGGNKGISLWRN